MYMITMALVMLSIPTMLMTLTTIIGKKTKKNREKLSPFECGFDPLKKARVPFSMRFFLITIVFLIFDVEMIIIIPFGFIMKTMPMDLFSIYINMIFFLLIFGLMYEWNQGVLNWIY